jgi:hypothetical protein
MFADQPSVRKVCELNVEHRMERRFLRIRITRRRADSK